MKDRVYEYILTKEEGVTAVHLNEVFPIGLHKIGGILLQLRNEGKVGKQHSKTRNTPNVWFANTQFRVYKGVLRE